MEIFKRLGIDQSLRQIGEAFDSQYGGPNKLPTGVPENFSLNVLFSTGLSDSGELIAKWNLPSVADWRQKIKEQNDGSMPREPYQRCSQAIFEAWLRPHVAKDPRVMCKFGLKFEELVEYEDHIVSTLVDQTTGDKYSVKSQYVLGCDGAGSRVRKSIGIGLTGGPTPGAMYLVHFKSRDLSQLHRQGQFWHMFFTNGPVIISQDEKDTWTVHKPVPLGTDPKDLDPFKEIPAALGTLFNPLPVQIDEILVTSLWRPNICLADRYISESGRAFLCGDAAHQNIPTGGYGMNTAVGDSFDLGWKVAAAVNGYGGHLLLQSYELERRPVAMRNIERSGVHWGVHAAYIGWWADANKADAAPGRREESELKSRIAQHVNAHDNENKDHGIEMGYRYNSSQVIVSSSEDATQEPEWSERHYIPSTWPGARAPHVFLQDGETSIFDLLGTGPEFTLVDFSLQGDFVKQFERSFTQRGIPFKPLHLPNERHAHKIWERDAVLIRPDDHVAWRAVAEQGLDIDADEIVSIVLGQTSQTRELDRDAKATVAEKFVFTSTVGNTDQNSISMLGEFQQ
ncbi:uncharacterized protein HMPREF1541_09605 [Cyphellophora europaea CBS 101466]|uniref:FAD-binding domain-containing protein n=1 Tax=Cyphellophora europaea (strain CBS 101466) TaxID=1220924 RepID=W2SAP4_CYPE1|nr:uncharacterized protein HMPREF1541_09605 [Cyphellophora europaea CBS 101466]ETN45772.1 hypothetical protein HMPREF1541_09605 [Cyphellophora europaea CBS 101466]